MSRAGAEREGDTESEAGSRPWAVSLEPDTGLELARWEIMTWAEVGRPTWWAAQVPQGLIFFNSGKSCGIVSKITTSSPLPPPPPSSLSLFFLSFWNSYWLNIDILDDLSLDILSCYLCLLETSFNFIFQSVVIFIFQKWSQHCFQYCHYLSRMEFSSFPLEPGQVYYYCSSSNRIC